MAMGKYTNENLKVLMRGVQSQAATPSLVTIAEVKALADDIYDWAITYSGINTWDSGIPVFTGNLLDSFGIGIYLNGTLVGLSMESQEYATITQSYNGEEYSGRDKLTNALNNSTDLGSGLIMRIFSASPISEMINEEGSPIDRGQGYFDRIAEYATQLATSRFKL